MLRINGTGNHGNKVSRFAAAEVNAAVAHLLENAFDQLERDRAAARRCVEEAAALLGKPQGEEPGPVQLWKDGIVRGGLAPWQCRRVTAHVEENLEATIAVEDLAALCRLSASHFSRAFKASFGEPPHSYIVRRRIDVSKRIMLESDDPLGQIAVACGFADQSHFCRHFRRAEGMSPNLWRRAHAPEPFAMAAE